jgi:hypothetical protein
VQFVVPDAQIWSPRGSNVCLATQNPEEATVPDPNLRLAAVIEESGLSASALSRQIGVVAAEWGVTNRTHYTQVGRWCAGQIPLIGTQLLIAEALSRRLGRQVGLAEIGFEGDLSNQAADWNYLEDPRQAVEMATRLWRADVARLGTVNGAVPAMAISGAALRWLLATDTTNLERVDGARPVTAAEVESLLAMSSVFTNLDNRFGGRHARLAAVQYLDDQVAPLLRGRYDDSTGKRLFAAAAELSLCVAWMAYDATQHPLARRYFTQALGLAKHAGDRRLGASVLSALSHQANLIDEPETARDLARAAIHAAQDAGSHTLLAQFAAMEARALASAGSRNEALRALGEAEEHFAARSAEDDPAWISYFDDAELAAEASHCHLALGDFNRAASELANFQDQSSEEYPRSNAFAGIVQIEALIGAGELEHAAEIGEDVLSACNALSSARIDVYLDNLRRRIEPVKQASPLAEFADQLGLIQTQRASRWPRTLP